MILPGAFLRGAENNGRAEVTSSSDSAARRAGMRGTC
jgi:hypothetical protein